MAIEINIPPDDLSLTVPAEQTEYATVYRTQNLTDHNGKYLTDHSGNYLVATTKTTESVYTIHVAPDDLSITAPEET